MRQHGRKPAASAGLRWNVWLITGAVIGSCALSSRAAWAINVDCSSPNDFCTGDPCVVKEQIEVTVPTCAVDFGTRALQLRQVIFVPNNGSLTLSAKSIELRRHINGAHIKVGQGDGADITLNAIGSIALYRPLDAAGQLTAGNITLTAGGNIDIRERLRARAKGRGAVANGGTVTVQAGGMVTTAHKGKIDVRGRISHSLGGHATIVGGTGVRMQGKIDARGSTAGNVRVASTLGQVVLKDEILDNGAPGNGGTLEVEAATNIEADRRLGVGGGAPFGGTIRLTAGGTITAASLFADGRFGAPAGTVAAVAGSITADRISVRGDTRGGVVDLASTTGDLDIDRIDARSKDGIGGNVRLSSAANLTNLTGTKAEGTLAGGRVVYTAAGDISLGRSNSSHFDATTGGLIQASATGNLTADGHFEVAGGCIALLAGGALDIDMAEFDGPLAASCK